MRSRNNSSAGTGIDRAGRRFAVDIHLEPALLEYLCAGQTAAISPELKRMIKGEEMTVAGVAAAVGYASLTTFNAAFRRKFGINPKRYQLASKSS